MITGAHTILYSTNSDADRAFLRDVLALPSVDVGGGWLIFGLPPAEIAVHPAAQGGKHELYLMCDDVEQFIAEMATHHIACGPIEDQGWGRLTNLTLPGGGSLGVYQPRHARPEWMPTKPAAAPRASKANPSAKPKAKTKPAKSRPTAKASKAKPTSAKSRTKSKPARRR